MYDYELKKRIYSLFSVAWLVLPATVLFILLWRQIYNYMTTFPYYFKGFLMLSFMYALLLGSFLKVFDGVQTVYFHRVEPLLSLVPSILGVNFIFYMVTCLLSTYLVPVWGFAVLTLADLLMLFLIIKVLAHFCDKVLGEQKLLLIYAGHSKQEVERICEGWDGAYKVETMLSADEGFDKCKKAIKKHRAVVLCDLPTELRDKVALYCQENNTAVYFVPGMSDMIFTSGHGLHYFEGHLIRLKRKELTMAQRFTLLSYLKKVYRGSIETLYERVQGVIERGEKEFIITANPQTFMSALSDAEFNDVLLREEVLTVPDGYGLIVALKLAGFGDYQKIAGVEFAKLLLKMAEIKSFKVFLYGASEEVIRRMEEMIKRDYPHVILKGAYNGYDHDHDEIMEMALKEKPDIFMAALGVPAQEKLIAKYYDRFEKGVFLGVGGSFDVLSGYKKRAPKVFLDLNLEWLYRICTEPSRIKKFVESNLYFMFELKRIKSIQ